MSYSHESEELQIEFYYDDLATAYLYSIYAKCRELNDSPLTYDPEVHRIIKDMLEQQEAEHHKTLISESTTSFPNSA